LTGSHTVRIWYGGAEKTRLALVGNLSESDLVRNGANLWVWSSKQKTAQHVTLPAKTADADAATKAQQQALNGLSPAQAAAQALAAIDPTTTVTVDGTAKVAGRSAYELVLRPKDSRSLIGSVRLAIDAKTHVPLRVQVYATTGGKPAFETGFTTVTFSPPPASVFRFTPPAGTKVSNKDLSATRPGIGAKGDGSTGAGVVPGTSGKSLAHKGSEPTVIGKGWTAIAEVNGVSLGSLTSSAGKGEGPNDTMSTLLKGLTPVSGSFGTGHVFKTKLVSFLLLDNGRAFIGAVPPSMLVQAADAAGK
jgi:outer membrane lipoprotein-sorting protein